MGINLQEGAAFSPQHQNRGPPSRLTMPRGPGKRAVVFTAFHSPEPFASSLTKQGGAFLLLKEIRMMCFSVSLSQPQGLDSLWVFVKHSLAH